MCSLSRWHLGGSDRYFVSLHTSFIANCKQRRNSDLSAITSCRVTTSLSSPEATSCRHFSCYLSERRQSDLLQQLSCCRSPSGRIGGRSSLPVCASIPGRDCAYCHQGWHCHVKPGLPLSLAHLRLFDSSYITRQLTWAKVSAGYIESRLRLLVSVGVSVSLAAMPIRQERPSKRYPLIIP